MKRRAARIPIDKPAQDLGFAGELRCQLYVDMQNMDEIQAVLLDKANKKKFRRILYVMLSNLYNDDLYRKEWQNSGDPRITAMKFSETTSMSLTDPKTINDLLGFSSDEEREEFAAERLQLDILHNVSAQMQQSGMTKSELAAHLDVSKSYVSQLFACDTPLNLRTLAKIERVLGGRFCVSFTTSAQNYDSVVDWPAADTASSENIIPFWFRESEFRPHHIEVNELNSTKQEVC